MHSCVVPWVSLERAIVTDAPCAMRCNVTQERDTIVSIKVSDWLKCVCVGGWTQLLVHLLGMRECVRAAICARAPLYALSTAIRHLHMRFAPAQRNCYLIIYLFHRTIRCAIILTSYSGAILLSLEFEERSTTSIKLEIYCKIKGMYRICNWFSQCKNSTSIFFILSVWWIKYVMINHNWSKINRFNRETFFYS